MIYKYTCIYIYMYIPPLSSIHNRSNRVHWLRWKARNAISTWTSVLVARRARPLVNAAQHFPGQKQMLLLVGGFSCVAVFCLIATKKIAGKLLVVSNSFLFSLVVANGWLGLLIFFIGVEPPTRIYIYIYIFFWDATTYGHFHYCMCGYVCCCVHLLYMYFL